MRACTRLIIDYVTESKVPGRLRIVWQVSKSEGKVSLRFQFKLKIPRVVSVHQNKNLQEWSQRIVGLYFENYVSVDI